MAGKHAVVLNGQKRLINSTVPSPSGVKYDVEVMRTAGAFEHISKNQEGLRRCLESAGLVSFALPVLECFGTSSRDSYNFTYKGSAGMGFRSSDEPLLVISLKAEKPYGKISLHMGSKVTEGRDESELFGNACVILDKVVSYVEDGRIW